MEVPVYLFIMCLVIVLPAIVELFRHQLNRYILTELLFIIANR